jgi:hypothetical protein
VVSLLPGLIMIWFVRHHIARGFTVGKSNWILMCDLWFLTVYLLH